MAKKSTENKAVIISYLKDHTNCSSKEILDGLALEISIATLKRLLQKMVSDGLVESKGALKNRRYAISPAFEIIRPVDVADYFKKEIDERVIKNSFNLTLINETLTRLTVFQKQN